MTNTTSMILLFRYWTKVEEAAKVAPGVGIYCCLWSDFQIPDCFAQNIGLMHYKMNCWKWLWQ